MKTLSIASALPGDWETIRFRYVANTSKGRLPVKSEVEPSAEEGSVPYLSMEYLRGNSDPTEFVSPDGMIAADEVDVLLLWDGSNAGEFLRSKYGAVSSTAALLSPIKFNRSYLFWLCKCIEPVLKTFTNGMGIPHVDGEILKNLRLPFPSDESYQHAIAEHLDRETSRIDALVEEKEQMLALLEEKRAALITRAVTRGLAPTPPLKPSGLDWLGDIPTHWGTPPVYARFEVQLGKMLDEKKIKGTHLAPYLRNVDVQWGKINTSTLPEMDFDDESRVRYSLQPGDVLVCEGGEIGRSAIWFGEIAECYYQKALHRLRPLNGHDDPSFFVYVMQTLVNLCVFSSQANAATIQHLPAEKLRTVRYPAPPIHEQHEIVSFLNRQTAHLEKMDREITHSIQLLKERRAALINAAVTAQIPVEEMLT